MSESRDVNDRAIDGTLPADPARETSLIQKPTLHVVNPNQVRSNASRADEAERAICASLLWAGTYAPEAPKASTISDTIQPSHFGDTRLGAIFDALVGLESEGKDGDAVSVHSAMQRRGLRVVDAGSLEKLVAAATAPTAAKLAQWAGLVKDAATRRQVLATSDRLAKAARDGSLSECRDLAINVSGIAETENQGTVTAAKALDTALRDIFDPKSDRGISSGIAAYDQLVGPIRLGHYTVVGGSTGDGKSAFGLTISGNVVTRGGGVLYASTEMMPDQLMLRLACSWASISTSRLIRYRHAQDATAVTGSIQRARGLPLHFFRSARMTPGEIDAKVRRIKAEMAASNVVLRLVIVDYIQEMQWDGASSRTTEEQNLRAISSALNDIAKSHNVHVMALAQTHPINAKAEGSDGRPNIHHIAGAKSIARPAENVLFIHRSKVDGKYPARGPADLVVRKSRWGARGDVPVIFDGPHMRFEDDPDRPLDEDR